MVTTLLPGFEILRAMMKETTTESPGERVLTALARRYQIYLDRTVVHFKTRWAVMSCLLGLYYVRVWFSQSHYIVTYGLHIFLLNLLIGFLSPAIDPESAELDGPVLPTSNEEFRPFSRRLPEMKAWHNSIRAISASLLMTFFSFFDVPVFWPILLVVRVLFLARMCAESCCRWTGQEYM